MRLGSVGNKGKSNRVALALRVSCLIRAVKPAIQHSFGSVGHSNQGGKRSKRNPDRKRRSETLAVCR